MNVFGLLTHIGVLVQMGRDVEGVVQNLVAHKEKFPSAAEFTRLIDDLLQMLSADLINMPKEVADEVVVALNSVRAQIAA